MEVLTEAILNNIEAEEMLLQNDHYNQLHDQKELEEELMVTKTVSSREVLADFENWIPASTPNWSPTNRPWTKSPSTLIGIVLRAKGKR